MYQAWPWGGTSSTASPTAGFVQPAATGQVPAAATTQWPAGYNQYAAAVTPEMQQQWAAAWASQAQFAYSGTMPVAGQVPATTTAAPYPGVYTETQPQASGNNAQSSDKPKNTAEELTPKDSSELEKLKQLKEQAEQWKSLQQPAAATSWNYSTAVTGVSVTAPTVSTSGEALKSNAVASSNASQPNFEQQNQMDQEEEEFERQFKDWEKQFDAWKEQNINHPDKEAFAQYEKQWQEWRAQLLQKKEQMQKAKAERLAAKGGQPAPAATPSTTTNVVDPTAAANAGLYYQQAQYMYMQPYVYPGSVPVGAPPAVPQPPQQFPFGGAPENYVNQPAAVPGPGVPQMNPNMNPKEMKGFEQDNEQYKYGQPGENFPHQNEYQNFEEFGNPNMYPPDMDEQFQRDMNFGRGRARGRGARGRGRGRGRGGRWNDPSETEGPPSQMRNMGPGLLDNPGEFQHGPGEFPDDSGDYPPGPGGFLPSIPRDFPQSSGEFPPASANFPRGPPRDFPPGPPGKFRDGPGEFRDGPREFNEGPAENQGPPFDYPPEDHPGDYPPENMSFPDEPPRQRRKFPPDERFPFRDGQPPQGKQPLLSHDGQPSLLPPRDGQPSLLRDGQPPPRLRDGQRDGPPPQPSNRYPPDEFEEEFPPPFDERFPPDSERFPPKEDRFMRDRDFDGYPPMDDGGYGPPPFREEFPPFDDRFPPGRGGRFPMRGRRFPPSHRGDFDRFGPPPGIRDGPFGPPDDRFPFPGEGPRMPPPGRGGPRPPFGPGNRFPDDPFFREGGPPMRFKSKDYTHRPSEDFNPHYEFENEFQEDVMQFRAPKRNNKRPVPRKAPVEKKNQD